MSNHARRTLPAAYWRYDEDWAKNDAGGGIRKQLIRHRKALRRLRALVNAARPHR